MNKPLTVPLAVKVPMDLATEIATRLRAILKLHEDDVKSFSLKLNTPSIDPVKLVDEQKALCERGRRVTHQAIVRLYLARGRSAVFKMDDRAVLKAVAADPIVRGRPVNTEARRGSRAA